MRVVKSDLLLLNCKNSLIREHIKKKSGDHVGLRNWVAIIVALGVVFGLFGSKKRDN